MLSGQLWYGALNQLDDSEPCGLRSGWTQMENLRQEADFEATSVLEILTPTVWRLSSRNSRSSCEASLGT